MTYTVETVSAAALDRARVDGIDASGSAVVRLTAAGGEPLRCCLRNASAGESCVLFGYEPELPAGPYREIGAVFAHAEPCDGPASLTDYPTPWIGRPQVLRAYDARGWIHDASRVHDGSDPVAMIAEILAHPEVTQIHSRNVVHGCYMFTVRR